MCGSLALFVVAIGLTTGPTDMTDKTCTKSEAMQAEQDIDFLKQWDDVYRWYRKFSHCDDGAIGEGYSDAVGKLLANHWANLNRLRVLAAKDKAFERFVVKHIDETLSADALRLIIENAQSDCPAGAQRLCKSIRTAASDASRRR
jgi:hypothetical protein